jgi:hypothetical protein
MARHLISNGQKLRLALYRTAEYELRARYEKGEKQALWEMLLYCIAYRWALPEWAAGALTEADSRFESGQLKTWEEIFGKPYRGKTRKGSHTKAQASPVWEEVNRLHREGRPIDGNLFEEVGQKFGIGKTRTSDLYYEFDQSLRSGIRYYVSMPNRRSGSRFASLKIAYRGDGRTPCLRVSSIGYGARFTVKDGPNGTPRFARWHDRGEGLAAASPMRLAA